MTINDELDEAFKQTIIFEFSGFLSGFLIILCGILNDDQTMIAFGAIPSIVFLILLFYAFSVRITNNEE